MLRAVGVLGLAVICWAAAASSQASPILGRPGYGQSTYSWYGRLSSGDDITDLDGRGFAIVVLNKRYSDQNRSLCERIKHQIDLSPSFTLENSDADGGRFILRPVYWLAKKTAAVTEQPSCKELTDQLYDFERADRLRERLGRGDDGPFLITFKSRDEFKNLNYRGLFDFTDLRSDEMLQNVALFKRDFVASDPNRWARGRVVHLNLVERGWRFCGSVGDLILFWRK